MVLIAVGSGANTWGGDGHMFAFVCDSKARG